ncbi:hypothetical protein D3C85_1628760 [compost metagenome]
MSEFMCEIYLPLNQTTAFNDYKYTLNLRSKSLQMSYKYAYFPYRQKEKVKSRHNGFNL